MWILAPWGALMPSLRKNTPANDPRTIQVRFRRVKDAVYCQQNYLLSTEDFESPIVTNAGTDYDARIYVRPSSLSLIMVQLAGEIDYTSFKDQTTIKHHDHQLHDAYYKVWSVLYDKLSTRKAFSYMRRSAHSTGRSYGKTAVQERVAETIYRTENREWRMKGASAREMADLMREIDAATADVVLPTEQELAEMDHQIHNDLERDRGPTEVNGHLDHTKCEHNSTPSARKRCRKRFYGRT